MQFPAEAEDLYFDEVEPDSILPEQFFDAFLRKPPELGERKLLAAVLADAVHCFTKHAFARKKRGQRLFCEAEAWLMQCDTGAPFEFEDVCGALGLNAGDIRKALWTWRACRMVKSRASKVSVHRVSGGFPRKAATSKGIGAAI
jgi:hypothetical protein